MTPSNERQSNVPQINRRRFLETATAGLSAGAMVGCGNDHSENSTLSQMYPIYRAAGTHRDLGRQHGEQAAGQIHMHLESMARDLQLSKKEIRQRALSFQPLFEEHCPHLLDEIRGLAEGAKIEFADALACNIRGVLKLSENGGCTTYVIGSKGTARGEILVGQNSDVLHEHTKLGYVLHLKPNNKPEVLIWTFGGMIGYHGINSAGVCHFANDLGGGGPKPRFGMPHYPVKRMMHECQRMSEVVSLLEQVPLAVNGNYVLSDGDGEILDIEATADGPEIIHDNGAGFIAHTNHYVCNRYATDDNHAKCTKDSFTRLNRMNSLIREKYGSIGVADVKTFLSDHDHHPTSICRHPQTGDSAKGFETAGMTAASIVAEPAQRRMHVSLGNPCENAFATYSMDEN